MPAGTRPRRASPPGTAVARAQADYWIKEKKNPAALQLKQDDIDQARTSAPASPARPRSGCLLARTLCALM